MRTIKIIFTVLCVVLFSACEHKELCYEHSSGREIQVSFSWEHLGGKKPTDMRLFFYPLNTSNRRPVIFDLPGTGGIITLPRGEYEVVCFNIDTENILQKNESDIHTLELTTHENEWRKQKSTTTTMNPPEFLCRDYKERIMIGMNGDNTLLFSPRQAISRLTFEITGIRNLVYAKGARGTLSGVASSLFVGSNRFSSEANAIAFGAKKEEDRIITGTFYFFGIAEAIDPNIPQSNVFTLFLNNGKVYTKSVDVTRLIHDVPLKDNFRDIYLKLNIDFEMPKPFSEGGLSPDVEEWDTEEIDIDM
ncbi:MAG: DUF5119 domain-containing protein [Bacteroides sp.]|uniref:DUF5119 domain-containing protein n=1 Tax=Bacteroides sp. TaxID=29523 RepID=UPI002FC76441